MNMPYALAENLLLMLLQMACERSILEAFVVVVHETWILWISKEEVWPINKDFRGNDRPRETRVNERIRAREVRLIDENGEMIGVMPPGRALDIARERNLDLVEISPNAMPPVCKLMDYGRYKYEQAKKENEARKNQ